MLVTRYHREVLGQFYSFGGGDSALDRINLSGSSTSPLLIDILESYVVVWGYFSASFDGNGTLEIYSSSTLIGSYTTLSSITLFIDYPYSISIHPGTFTYELRAFASRF